MRPQQHFAALTRHFVGEIECIMHRAGRMCFGNIERGEIVPVVFDLTPFGNRKAHVGKDFGKLVHDLADRMHCAARRFGRRQCHVDIFACETPVQLGCFQGGFFRGQRRCHAFAQTVDNGALRLTFIGRHRAHRLEQRRNAALLTKGGYPNSIQRIQRIRGINRCHQFGLECRNICHHGSPE